MATVWKDIEVEVDIDARDFSTDELIEELRSRGHEVIEIEERNAIEDNIRNLREDFINWYQFGMKNEDFEKTLKKFFFDTIDEYIS